MKLTKVIPILLFSLFTINGISQEGPSEKSKQKLEAAFDIISRMYVDDLEDEEMVEEAINGILKKLDPHSYYIEADKVEALNEPLTGSFQGIGIHFNILYDTIIVVAPIPGGPSERLGVQAGDKIVAIENENVAGIGLKNENVREKLLGENGTEVGITVQRRGEKELLQFDIERGKIPISSIDASYILSPEIGYIKINRFAATTVKEFRSSMADLKKDGMKNLVLDLRGNTGGYLLAAYELADEFLENGKLIVYYEGENNPKRELNATSRGSFEDGKLVVLIDEKSASASEILAGAIQDWDRGLVIGRRSYGKGLVQREFELPDGAAIRLTVARYYTPSGRSIQKPYDQGTEAYKNEINQRVETGADISTYQPSGADTLKYYTSNNRVVYGGGGIMPDIYIKADTLEISKFYNEAVRSGLMNLFALKYVDRNRGQMKNNYADLSSFINEFNRREVLKQFVAFAEKEGIEPSKKDLRRSEKLLENHLTALVARNFYDDSAYFQILNERNDFVFRAQEVMEKNIFEDMKVYN